MTLAEFARNSGFCRVAGETDDACGEVLLIHGLGESSSCFSDLLESARLEGWVLVAPDLPGYGRTPSKERFLLPDFASLLAGWIESSDRLPRVVLGHSMGGVIGQWLCERVPDQVDAFVNVEGNLSAEDCTASRVAARESEEDFLASGFARLLQHVRQTGMTDPAFASYATSMELCQVLQFYQNSLELVEVSSQEQLARLMADLAFPTVYIAGMRGRPVPSRSLALLEESGANWLGFSASGHWPFIDEPNRFRQVLSDLLRGLAVNSKLP